MYSFGKNVFSVGYLVPVKHERSSYVGRSTHSPLSNCDLHHWVSLHNPPCSTDVVQRARLVVIPNAISCNRRALWDNELRESRYQPEIPSAPGNSSLEWPQKTLLKHIHQHLGLVLSLLNVKTFTQQWNHAKKCIKLKVSKYFQFNSFSTLQNQISGKTSTLDVHRCSSSN